MAVDKLIVAGLAALFLTGCMVTTNKTDVDFQPVKYIICPTDKPEDKTLPWPKESFQEAARAENALKPLIKASGKGYEAYKSKDTRLNIWDKSYDECVEAYEQDDGWF